MHKYKEQTYTTLEQAVITALRERDGGIYSHELASYACIPKAQIAGVVSSLVKKGAVTKDSFGPGEDFISLADNE